MTDQIPVKIKEEPADCDEDAKPHNFVIEITPLLLEEPHQDEEIPFAIEKLPGEWNLARHLRPPLPPPVRDPIQIRHEPPKLDFTQPAENITVKIEPFDILEPSERRTHEHIKQETLEPSEQQSYGHIKQEKILEQYIDHRKNTKKRLCEQKIVIDPSVKLLNRESRPFVCIECGLSFIRNADLNVHFRTHSGEKPFACPQCDLKFTQKGNLKRHIQTHTGLKPYECHDCNMKFAQKSLLQMHWRTHSGARPFQCSQCGQKFTTKSLVITHFRTHTGERPYTCNECGKTFAQKHTLDCHARIHSGEKPYECNICNKRFRFRNTCTSHAKTHSDVKPFGCEICGTSYKNKSTLRKHQIKNHQKPGGKQRSRKRTKRTQKYSLDYDANGLSVGKGMISDDRKIDLNLGECRSNL